MTQQASYVHGGSDKPLIGQTIGQFFDAACQRYAARDGLIVRQQGVRWSYAEFGEQVTRLACGLRRLGLQPGERIGQEESFGKRYLRQVHLPGCAAGGVELARADLS